LAHLADSRNETVTEGRQRETGRKSDKERDRLRETETDRDCIAKPESKKIDSIQTETEPREIINLRGLDEIRRYL